MKPLILSVLHKAWKREKCGSWVFFGDAFFGKLLKEVNTYRKRQAPSPFKTFQTGVLGTLGRKAIQSITQ
jgi:hypothetical protein